MEKAAVFNINIQVMISLLNKLRESGEEYVNIYLEDSNKLIVRVSNYHSPKEDTSKQLSIEEFKIEDIM